MKTRTSMERISARARRVLVPGEPDYRRPCRFILGLRCGVDPWLCPSCADSMGVDRSQAYVLSDGELKPLTHRFRRT